MEKKRRIVEKVTTQEKEDLLADYASFLSKGRFVNVATCSLERMPNVAPKLIAKSEKNTLYLIDYVMGKTFANLKENPRVSICFFNDKILTGYQLNGTVNILEGGEEFRALTEEFQQIKTNLTVERILLNLRTGGKASPMEFSLPEECAILKMRVIEIVEISSSGARKSKIAF